ncbi:uncharacterized protein Z518_07030 [Rhinocladiella mackenziei CBS 650.93]|uniref:Heterokaryon incompatibility domain-containing protein n=1 Tax=Rhinocladiella mackenziei CBS 650.93 TaxID=1442369 RepID=A0A0D2FN54_9EURO|nr:uncharacterized protein Z518_07030 [Rhinocladiella mackenziei CBS 650.93]KIX03477.1 hypothetical protein Z518_07030 [Rhinocladiella mackenziei CBS 650.93]
MDHFHIPSGAMHIRVRYSGKKPYDRGPFHTYPDRTGWKKEELLVENGFRSRNKSDAEAFFQTWLYFGTLITVFRIGRVEIQETDFLEMDDGQTYLTTKHLDASVAAWKRTWAGRNTPSSCNCAWADTQSILDEVKKHIDSFGAIPCPTFDEPSFGYNRPRVPSPVSRETLTAIVALAYTLSEVAIKIYKPDWNRFDQYINYTTDLVKDRVEANGWCQLDMRRMFTQLGMDGHYYFALLESPHEKHEHKNCSETHCVAANTVDETAYRPRHVSTCNGRDEINAAEAMNITKQVVAIIERHGIPVISWQKKKSETRFKLVIQDAVSRKMKYVAISHVWADGLGNPHANSLPECQLGRIQSAVNMLPGQSGTQPRWFWIDTICIPLGAENKLYRKMAIAQMAKIYRSSVSVLVLDAWLQETSVHSNIPDKVAKLYVSNWLHRLWTVQESVLGNKLYIQFSNGAQLMDDIKVPCESYGEGEKMPKSWATYTRFPEQMEEAALSYIGVMQFVLRERGNRQSKLPAARCLDIAHLSRAFGQRATSRKEDETICASTLLRLNTETFLGIEGNDEDETAEKRMEEFWKQMRGVSKGIIFHHSSRLRRKGFRWAPLTLMEGRPGDFWRDLNIAVSQFDGYGLRVNYSGIIFDRAIPPPDKTLAIQLDDRSSTSYSLELFPDGIGYPEWHAPAQCAVIMFRPISPGFDKTDAILGIVEDGSPREKISLLFQARGVIKSCQQSGRKDVQEPAFFLDEKQEWLVL